MYRVSAFGVLVLGVATVLAQQAKPTRPNELVVGKLVCVAPVETNLDQWILDFLRRWGKYKVTGDCEGADLVVRTHNPEKELELEMRQGVPQPKGEGKRFPVPGQKKERKEPAALSVTVSDWATNEPLWYADILDRKQKKDEPDPPVGPETKIFARGMTPDQLAQRITARLREYVEGLEKAGPAKP